VSDDVNILALIRQAAAKRVLFLPHAVRQMSRPDRLITTSEVHRVFAHGEVIEDYPEAVRGHSCLLLGHGEDDRPIHVVCSPKEVYLAVVTVYVPDENEWTDDFRVRTKS